MRVIDFLISFYNTLLDYCFSFFDFSFLLESFSITNLESLYTYILFIEIIIFYLVIKISNSIRTSFIWSNYAFPFFCIIFNNRLLKFIITKLHNFVTFPFSVGISTRIESFLDIFFLIIPSVIIIYILIPSLGLLYNGENYLETLNYSFTLDVVGHQWYWSYSEKVYINGFYTFVPKTDSIYHYDSIMNRDVLPYLLRTDNDLILPSKTNILLSFTSADVIHSWSLPAAGIKIDCIPGRISTTNIIFHHTGLYFGQCSELCGANHAFMPICIKVVDSHTFFSYSDLLYFDFENPNLFKRYPRYNLVLHHIKSLNAIRMAHIFMCFSYEGLCLEGYEAISVDEIRDLPLYGNNAVVPLKPNDIYTKLPFIQQVLNPKTGTLMVYRWYSDQVFHIEIIYPTDTPGSPTNLQYLFARVSYRDVPENIHTQLVPVSADYDRTKPNIDNNNSK